MKIRFNFKTIKKLLLLFLLAVVVVTSLIVILMWKVNLLSEFAEDFLNQQVGPQIQVQYESLNGSLFNHLQIKKIRLRTEQGFELGCNFLQIDYAFWPLLSNRFEIKRLIFDQLEIYVPQDTTQQEGASVPIDSLLASWQKFVSPAFLLNRLPDIHLKNLEILSGQFEIKGTPLKLNNIVINVSGLKIRKNHIALNLENIKANWPAYNLKLKSFSLNIEGDSTGITLNQGFIKTDNSHLYFNALLNSIDGLNLNLTDFKLHLAEFKHLMHLPLAEPAYLQGSLSFSGMPVHFGIQGLLKGQWQNRQLDSLIVVLEYNRGELLLNKFVIQSNFAQLSASAYWNQWKQITGEMVFRNINLHQMDQKLPFTQINGQLTLNAENLYFKKLTGKSNLTFSHCFIDTIEIDSINLKLSAQQGFYHFLKPSFIKIADSSLFYLEGSIDRHLKINLDLFTFNNQLAQTLRDLGLARIKGRMDGRLHLQGPLNNPDFSSTLFVPYLAYDVVRLDSLKFNLYIHGLAKERLGSGSFQILSGKIDQLPIDRVSFNVKTHGYRIDISDLTFISGPNYFSTNIFVYWQKALDSLSVKFFPFKVQYENYWLAAQDSLTVTMNPKGFVLESFTLIGPQHSEINVNGFYDSKLADFQTAISFNQFEIAPFEQFLKSGVKFSGKINGFVEILTPITDLSIESELSADSLFLQNVFLGHFNSSLYFARDQFTIKDFTLANDSTFLGLSGEFATRFNEKKFNILQDTELNVALDWQHLQLKHYAPLFKGIRHLRGLSSGKIAIKGKPDNPQIKMQLQLDKFNFDQFPGDSLRVLAHYEPDKIVLDSLSVVFDGSSIKASGWFDYRLSLVHLDTDILNKPFSLHLQSEDDQIFFLRNVIEEVESIQGPYKVDLHLAGTPQKPAIKSGTISLTNGQLLLSIIRDPIKNVQFNGIINNNILTINTFTARSVEEKDLLEKIWRLLTSLLPWTKRTIREGTFSCRGTINLSNVIRPELNLAIKMDEFYIDYFIQNVKLLLTTNDLTITGRDTITVAGRLYIPKGVVEVDLNQMARSVYLTKEVIKPEPPFIALNLNVEIPGNFTITSSPLNLANNFRVVFMGNLQINMIPPSDEPAILGHLEATNGKYASWNQNFIVQTATIDFKNKIPMDPDIDVIAVKQIGSKKFELALNGSLSKLNQQIRVFENGRELNISTFDKISLLTLGADISTMQANPDSALRGMGEQIATTSILTAMERSAEKLTGLDRVEINARGPLVNLSRFKLNNGLSDASIAFGKYLTSDLYVEYRTQFGGNIPAPRLSWDAGNRIGLQYRINRYWSLDSYYEKTERGNTRIRFGLNWEYSF